MACRDVVEGQPGAHLTCTCDAISLLLGLFFISHLNYSTFRLKSFGWFAMNCESLLLSIISSES